MANGVYGSLIPAMIADEDMWKYVDIFYAYSPTRNSNDVDDVNFERVSSDDVPSFIKCVRANIEGDNTDNLVEGMYNLRLPADIFGRKGFYTIYIKPKEIPATIMDVSTLKDFPNVRGVVLDTKSLPQEISEDAGINNALVGFRMILRNGNSRSKEVRIITSNNRCKPIATVSDNANAKSYAYQYNEFSDYTFITLTPSMPLSYKTSSLPYIGVSNQDVYLVNTMFEPICIELEMVDNDADSLANMIGGSQLRDLNSGIITTYDDDNNIVMQHEMSTLKRTETGTPQYEIRENRKDNIDFSQTLTDKL